MPKVSPIYTNFNVGELSDLLDGRSDLEQYNRGGKDCRNGIGLIYGPFLGRPGTLHMEEVKDSTKKTRLLEFVFSPTDANIIEMGENYFRFYDTDGRLGAPYEVAHTYTEAELFDVHFAQSNDVITLTHENHKPATLTRSGPTSWALADYDLVGNPYLPDNTSATTITPSGTTGAITLAASANIFEADDVGTFWKIGEPTGSPEVQGFVEITAFTDAQNVNADVISTLSTGSATTDWAESAWSDATDKGWPARCGYFQNRLCFARSTAEPNGLWLSRPFIFDDFNPGTGLADDAISEIVKACNDVKWIQGSRRLVIGSDVGDFVVESGDASGVITPESLGINQNTRWGSEAIQPEFIGSYLYPIQLKSRKVRELSYLFQEDSYKSADTTVLSEHITESGIVQTAYQRDPYSLMYCVLNNGKMAVMVRESDQAVLGWTPFLTENGDGEFESVAIIPHPTEDYDAVFVVVKRTIDGVVERHVEQFKSPIIPSRQEDCFYLDDGLTFNAFEQTTGVSLTLSATTGDGITVTAGAAYFTSAMEDRRIRAIDANGDRLGELVIKTFNSTTEVIGDVVDDFSATSYAAEEWGVSVVSLSGLDHLEGKTVNNLTDGGVGDPAVVSSGSVTISDGADGKDGFIVNVGLGYTTRWKNMPIEAGSANGTAQTKRKRIYECGFKFYRSLGMQVGADEDHLKDLILRDPQTNMGEATTLQTGVVEPRKIDSTWDVNGHITLQQQNPLPMCILAVVPFLETNDE